MICFSDVIRLWACKKKVNKIFLFIWCCRFFGIFLFFKLCLCLAGNVPGTAIVLAYHQNFAPEDEFYRENFPSHTHKMKNRSQGDVLYTNYD